MLWQPTARSVVSTGPFLLNFQKRERCNDLFLLQICKQLQNSLSVFAFKMRLGQRSRYSDWLGAGGFGDRTAVKARFSGPIQHDPVERPASCTLGTGFVPGQTTPVLVMHSVRVAQSGTHVNSHIVKQSYQLSVINTVIIICILLCVFRMNKTDRNSILTLRRLMSYIYIYIWSTYS